MKKMKKMLALVLSAVILIGMMMPIAYAKSINETVVSIPSRNICTTYNAYDDLWMAKSNKIILYVKQDEFPIYATLYGSNGAKEEYKFSSYGTKQLEVNNGGGGTILLYLLTFLIGGPLWIPEPKVYAIIEIAPPQQEKPKVESTEKSEDPDAKLETLIEKIKRMSNYSTGYTHERHIKDYASGKWDGTVEYSYDGMTYGSIDYRTYRWRGVEPFTGKYYNDIDVNIDYVGSLDVVTNRDFTFAVNYYTGEIEQWILLEKKDSWKLQLAEGEKIERVYASYTIPEDELQGMVFTNDLDGNMHYYWLFPNKKVENVS